jgi:hypothetical protein
MTESRPGVKEVHLLPDHSFPPKKPPTYTRKTANGISESGVFGLEPLLDTDEAAAIHGGGSSALATPESVSDGSRLCVRQSDHEGQTAILAARNSLLPNIPVGI